MKWKLRSVDAMSALRLRSEASAELDFAIDLVIETDFADGEDHLGVDGFVALQAAVGHRRADRLLDLLL